MNRILTIILLIFVSSHCAVGQILSSSQDSISLKGVKKIPKQVFLNEQLTFLSIFGQDCDIRPMECFAINKLPPEIGKLKNLKELRLTLNYITELPQEILRLKSLKILDLTENQHFSDLKTVSKMTWLEEFYCFGCYISEVEIEKLRKKLPNCKILIE